MSKELRNTIREKFELTLNLDPRYRVLALLLALAAPPNESGEVLPGFSVRWIRQQALHYWPAGFRDCISEDDYRALLDEMEGLGVLREVTDRRFALRTPNILYLLGTKEEIEDKLIHSMDAEPAPRYDALAFRTAGPNPGDWKRNPLTMHQESRLREASNGLALVAGVAAAGVEDLVPFLEEAFGNEYFSLCGAEATTLSGFVARLAALDRERFGTTALVVKPESAWTDTWIQEAASWVRQRRHRSSYVRIIFIADPATLWQLSSTQPNLLAFLVAQGVDCLSLQPWHKDALWHWLGECGVGSNTTEEQKEIEVVTGNWPKILLEFKSKLNNAIPWREALADCAREMEDPEGQKAWLGSFGLANDTANTILGLVAELGPIPIEEISLFAGEVPKDVVERRMVWADMLSLVRPTKDSRWLVDPIVSRLLKR
jgi:hypothetical protein